MKWLGVNEIREKFLAFFESKGHLRLPSFSLVPQGDKSILLINAGMTPLKPYFTGAQIPPNPRITTCQKCIRTPDIEQVGITSRHGTFFEMLGNFSFGDYFKEETIAWAWEFCVDVIELPPERLHITVYLEDDEAYDIWHEKIGLPAEKITRLGKEHNFWEHGTGPCGPCTEIHFDRGEEYSCGPDCAMGCDCDRFVELWNLVFTQFDRLEDGSYVQLEQKNIDTGGGLERFAAVLQGVQSLFEVDTVRCILDRVCTMAGVEYGQDTQTDIYVRVVTDHIRSTVMMVSDGIIPGNTGRGYVLRRLLRRAARCGRLLGIDKPFLVELAEVVIGASESAYPELRTRAKMIFDVIRAEESSFAGTIEQGTKILADLLTAAKKSGAEMLPGADAFLLHDTYGFPIDLTREIAAESGMSIDEAEFKRLMARQREQAQEDLRSRAGSAWGGERLPAAVQAAPPTVFTGYTGLTDRARLLYILRRDPEQGLVEIPELSVTESDWPATGAPATDEIATDEVSANETAVVLVFDKTPFYAASGGQVGDQGRGEVVAAPDENEESAVTEDARFEIIDTTHTDDGHYLHFVRPESGTLRPRMTAQLRVDAERRRATAANHSATHLLHSALRRVLGEHVMQAGSSVNPERLRFDFSHYNALSEAELAEIEAQVNRAILADFPVVTEEMALTAAQEAGVMALFSEKYADEVRVVKMGSESAELCGGTHVGHTAQIGQFRIVSEGSVASGVRRIEAVTGWAAYEYGNLRRAELSELARILRVGGHELERKARELVAELAEGQKKIRNLEAKLNRASVDDIVDQAEDFDGIRFLAAEVPVADPAALRELAEQMRSKLAPAVVLLAGSADEKVALVCMASPEAIQRGVKAGDVARLAAQAVGGGGGGRPDMAQAGGRQPEKVGAALTAAREHVAAKLS